MERGASLRATATCGDVCLGVFCCKKEGGRGIRGGEASESPNQVAITQQAATVKRAAKTTSSSSSPVRGGVGGAGAGVAVTGAFGGDVGKGLGDVGDDEELSRKSKRRKRFMNFPLSQTFSSAHDRILISSNL